MSKPRIYQRFATVEVAGVEADYCCTVEVDEEFASVSNEWIADIDTGARRDDLWALLPESDRIAAETECTESAFRQAADEECEARDRAKADYEDRQLQEWKDRRSGIDRWAHYE